jgi:DNA repair exonuclease SbcCD nuclease subunit
MSKILFIGDVHLEHSFPHSIASGRERYRDKQLAVLASLAKLPDTKRVYLGDIFDKYNVSVRSFLDAYRLIGCDSEALVLAGNHDFSKNIDTKGSLQMMADMPNLSASVAVTPRVEMIRASNNVLGITMLPHQLTQELFDSEIASLVSTNKRGSNPQVLILHCNYGDWDGKSFENYLTTEQHNQLASIFDLIVSGHQHDTSVHFPKDKSMDANGGFPFGTLVFPGSLLPVNFGEMGSKSILTWESTTGEFQFVPTDYITLDAKYQYEDYPAESLIAGHPLHPGVTFATVSGDITPSDNIALTKAIQKVLHAHPTLIACKSQVNVIRQGVETGEEIKPDLSKTLSWIEEVMTRLNFEGQTLLNNRLEK